MSVNIEILADFRSFFEKVAEAETKMQAVGAKMALVGAGFTAAVTLPMALFAKKAIEASGELEEVGKQINQIKDEALAELGRELVETFSLDEKMESFRDFIGGLITGFKNLNPAVKKAAFIIAGLAAAAGPALAILGGIVAVLPKIIMGLSLLMSPITAVVAGIAALGAISLYLKSNQEAVLKTLINMWIKFRNTLVDSATKMLQVVGDAMVAMNPLQSVNPFLESIAKLKDQKIPPPFDNIEWKSAGEVLEEYKQKIKDFIFTGDEVFKFTDKVSGKVTESAEQALKDLGSAMAKSAKVVTDPAMALGKSIGKAYKEGIKQSIAPAIEELSQFTQQLNETIERGLEDMVGTFAHSVGQMLAADISAKDVGRNLLLALADFAGTFGSILIAHGIATEAFKKSLESLNGVGAVVAGAALVATAGLVRGTINKGLESGGGGYSGGASGVYGGSMSNQQPIVMETIISGREMILTQRRESSFRR